MKIIPQRLSVFVLMSFGGLSLASVSDFEVETDREIAVKYCSGCHLFPEPELLDKKTWLESVLPNMAWRLGTGNVKVSPYDDMDQGEINLIKAQNIFPEKSAISEADWSKIVRYYEKEAPEIPPAQAKQAEMLAIDSKFELIGINLKDQKLPQITMLTYDERRQKLFVADAVNELVALDQNFAIRNIWNTDSPTVDMVFTDDGASILTIGSILPSEKKKGRLTALDTAYTLRQRNLQLLHRPTQIVEVDINQDKRKDWVVSEFGNNAGQLVWFENGELRKKRIIKSQAGARKVEVLDLNKDGKPDLVGMFAQAHEEIVFFYNQGNGSFVEKTVLKFQPTFGSSYFEMVDFNKDGSMDILLSNGDNWDLSKIDKNYHGVRIFLNDKKDNFSEAFFYPLFGTSKVLSFDFDQDGDLDLAAISFYSDNETGFVYFENQGDLSFKAYSSGTFSAGKWLTMEKLDFDRDGDMDIVLGTYFHNALEMGKLMAAGFETLPQLMVLKNKLK